MVANIDLHWPDVLNLHNLLKMNDSLYVCYGAGQCFQEGPERWGTQCCLLIYPRWEIKEEACRFLWYHPGPAPRKGYSSNSEYWIAACLFSCYGIILEMPHTFVPGQSVNSGDTWNKYETNLSLQGTNSVWSHLTMWDLEFQSTSKSPQLSLARQK